MQYQMVVLKSNWSKQQNTDIWRPNMSKVSCKLVYDLKKLKLKCAFNLSISSLDFLLYFFRPQNLTKILLPIKVSGGSKYIFYDIL